MFLAGLLYVIIIIGLKIFSKNISIIFYNDYFEIDTYEIIYYKNVIECYLEEIKVMHYNIITGYILKLKYDEGKKIKLVVLTGTSEKEKINCEYLLAFYNELNKRTKILN
jgi:hypothetical protein